MGKLLECRTRLLIEGTDCTGTTTLTRNLAQAAPCLNGRDGLIRNAFTPGHSISHLVATPNNPYAKRLDNLKRDEKGLLSPLLAMTIMFDICNHSRDTRTTVVDSWHGLRAAAYELAAEYPMGPVLHEIARYAQQAFDATVLLHASVEEKRKRLVGRPEQATANDKLIFTNPEFIERMDYWLQFLAKMYMNAVVIDTTNLSVEEVAEEAIEGLKDRELHLTHRENSGSSIYPERRYIYRELSWYVNFLKRKRRLQPYHHLPPLVEPMGVIHVH